MVMVGTGDGDDGDGGNRGNADGEVPVVNAFGGFLSRISEATIRTTGREIVFPFLHFIHSHSG